MGTANGDRRRLSVGIVGAGFGGVGLAMRLRQLGHDDFTIFERGESVGGVWRANTYPGAACDVPSHLYSFSFEPGHDWSHRYAPQRDILGYLERCKRDYALEPHIRFGTEVTAATFDEAAGRWTVETEAGERHEFDVLVSACGQLTRPDVPPIQGTGEFEGRAFHSAEWDHAHDLRGRRVAVIGTGASAIQFVPEIAPLAEGVTIYQRSAPWILPKSDRPYPEWERRLFERFPLRVVVSRAGIFAFFEVATYAFTGTDWLRRAFRRVADRHRERELPDPELRAKATPDYDFGCKRILVTNDWYATLRRADVELVAGGASRITPTGVVDAEGVEREADTIIYGTGFETHNFVAPMEVRGLGGRELNDVWAGTPEAYLGTTVAGFPNMFVLYGPNTGHGAGSVPYTLESQFNYVLDAMRHIRERDLRWIDLRPEVQAGWHRELSERSARSVWTGDGCRSWYLTAAGVNTNNWPGPWLEYRRRTRRIQPGEYRAAVTP